MPETTTPDTSQEILRHVSLFQDVRDNAEAMSLIVTMMRTKSFPAGHVLIEQGTSGS